MGALCASPVGLRWHLGRKRRVGLLAAVALLTAGLAVADTKPAMKKLAAGSFTLNASPISSFGRGGTNPDTGKLSWRGGLLLESSHKNFGGWSGLVIEPDGRRFLSVSDAGAWMSGEITYAGTAPSGIAKARIGPLLSLAGTNLKKGKDRDAEAIALLSGNLDKASLLVAFEQNARIARYDFANGTGASPTRGFVELPDSARAMSRNGGFEAMTVVKGGPYAGSLIAFSERLRDNSGAGMGWVWSAGSVVPVKLQDKGGYDIADIASLEDGSLIVLERRFRWLEGLYIRLRLLPAKSIGQAQPIEGETLLEADLTAEIDNMEGLAISRDVDGTAILTLISDDNFNKVLQRTLLLQFAYPNDPAKSTARPVTAKARP